MAQRLIPLITTIESILREFSTTPAPEAYYKVLGSRLDPSNATANSNLAPSKNADPLNSTVRSAGGDSADLISFYIKDLVNNFKIRFRCSVDNISHTSNPNWSEDYFTGRPYPVYYYNSVSRGVSLGFTAYGTTPQDLKVVWEKLNYLEGLTHPSAYNDKKYVIPPYIEFSLGDLYKNQPGFINSLTLSIDRSSTWETRRSGMKLPHFISVSMGISIIEKRLNTPNSKMFGFNTSYSNETIVPDFSSNTGQLDPSDAGKDIDDYYVDLNGDGRRNDGTDDGRDTTRFTF